MSTSTDLLRACRPLGFENDGSRQFDISGLAVSPVPNSRPFLPCAGPSTPTGPSGRIRLFEDGRFATPDGRARLLPLAQRFPEQPETPRLQGLSPCSSTVAACGISGTP